MSVLDKFVRFLSEVPPDEEADYIIPSAEGGSSLLEGVNTAPDADDITKS